MHAFDVLNNCGSFSSSAIIQDIEAMYDAGQASMAYFWLTESQHVWPGPERVVCITSSYRPHDTTADGEEKARPFWHDLMRYGTDTMAHTSIALSFLLDDLGKTVVTQCEWATSAFRPACVVSTVSAR